MAYSTSKAASVKPDQKFKPYFIVWGLLMQCWKLPQRCSENITVFFPTCTSGKKLNLLVPPVKLLLNLEAIPNFYFQKSFYLSGYRYPQNRTFLCLLLSVSLSPQTSLSPAPYSAVLVNFFSSTGGVKQSSDIGQLNIRVSEATMSRSRTGSRYKNAKSLFTSTKRQVLFDSISSQS